MSLLRDGTVFLGHISEATLTTDSKAADKSGSDEVAPIEAVTTVVEGLSTTFTFTFRATEEEKTQPPCSLHIGYTILCAEDNIVNQRILAKILQRHGQDFIMTETGQMALDVYKSDPGRFPCIFMDLVMPVMGGQEATKQIRAFESSQPGHRRPLIVGLFHPYTTELHISASEVGFDIIMRKPLNQHDLREMFMGGPRTNVVMLYGCLTEEEKKAYPLTMVESRVFDGTDPRSKAIRNELLRRKDSDWAVDYQGRRGNSYTKIIVKIVRGDEDEQM